MKEQIKSLLDEPKFAKLLQDAKYEIEGTGPRIILRIRIIFILMIYVPIILANLWKLLLII